MVLNHCIVCICTHFHVFLSAYLYSLFLFIVNNSDYAWCFTVGLTYIGRGFRR
jgi:hypothetical protein